ncbi:MAG: hypothetical protein Q7T93_17335 [Methylobacterium sp.]|uniref:hypothetical protein n=1 Tax=unclassified Methylobacterium TaxID=2615210 RepID=UPI0006FC3269|nr:MULTISPECIES: hypothetical protein [unclassified Methylobacterium]KQP11208.1 hypothetical protein ASF28_09195 [Methylobacterium sp. Leaf99]MDO9428580.1 hypothetical protein [Methylobacterium sp.]TXM73719.1 hypothetical protein FV218_10920 [Methylobacterium sp. WL69]
MLHPFKLLCAGAVIAGVALVPVLSHAQGAKPESKSAKADAKKTEAAVDEFEENRRAHMQKSKENNASKGAN